MWEGKKSLIIKLYRDEGWPLKHVIKRVRTECFDPRFIFSESQLRSRLKKWRIGKTSRRPSLVPRRRFSQAMDRGNGPAKAIPLGYAGEIISRGTQPPDIPSLAVEETQDPVHQVFSSHDIPYSYTVHNPTHPKDTQNSMFSTTYDPGIDAAYWHTEDPWATTTHLSSTEGMAQTSTSLPCYGYGQNAAVCVYPAVSGSDLSSTSISTGSTTPVLSSLGVDS
ncbi:Clr5 domain-containing protein [Aspergillus alliaceus]|uniref:Clr5 domain-containing protein n=1 Tax=Petromyces alliaceus TaxID=209559 RepID=UPI0012A5B913|nr:uncharacterized protein BDW43DRAFT_294513 [Aspergillus alliaceus]KAB8227281.1 hypothetical protein BDW43DRAFT_294513 [Aspergillus alliaceus]